MSEELQQKLRSQLWTVANTLRGNMSASDFMYFTTTVQRNYPIGSVDLNRNHSSDVLV